MQLRRVRYICALALAAISLPYAMALSTEASASAGIPLVKTEIIRDFARITFEWPRHSYLSTSQEGNSVTLNFDRRVDLDFAPLLSSLSPYITKIALSSDERSLTIYLDKPYRVRSFVTGTINGIDILDVDPKAKRGGEVEIITVKAKKKPTVKPVVEEAKEEPPAEEKTATAQEMASLAPAAGEEMPDLLLETGTSVEKKEPLPPAAAPEPEQAPPAETPPAEASPAEPAPVADEPAPAEEVTAEAEQPATSAEEEVEAPVIPGEESTFVIPEGVPDEIPEQKAEEAAPIDPAVPIQVFAETQTNRNVLRFAWKERVAAASFVRAGNLWIVFSRKANLDLGPVQETATELYPAIEVIETDENATLVRISVSPETGVVVNRPSDSFEWSIVMVANEQPPLNLLRLDVNTAPPLTPHLFVALSEAADPVTFTDPDVGDELVVIPTYRPAQGVYPRRGFVDFDVFNTGQGIALRKTADNVAVTPIRNGLRIGTQSGASLSSDLPDEIKPKEDPSAQPTTEGALLFPYVIMRGDASVPMYEQIQTLENTLSLIDNKEKQSQLRLKIAKIFLAYGMATESLGVLSELKRVDPQYYIATRASALTGGANFLLHRFDDAADHFAAAELQGSKEVKLWRDLLSELLGAESSEYDFFAHNDAYIVKYPPVMRKKLTLLAADRAIADKRYNQALQIIESLQEGEGLADVEDYVAYLLARIAGETGRDTEAVNTWTMLSQNYASPLVRTRAEYSLIRHEVLNNPPDKLDGLIERLHRLSFSWRGDDLEREILRLLAELYAQNDDYVMAMKTWRNLVEIFPNTIAAAESLERMRGTFIDLFNDGIATKMPPFEQLALYYEFRSLTPSGEVGDRIVNDIADRLIALDMLDQAITLLNYRMRYVYEKQFRSQVGSKLAQVYLMDKQPKEALAALRSSVYGNNPADLQLYRDRLAARAMIEQGLYSEAFSLMETDRGSEAENIRQLAYWKQKDWPKLIESIEGQLQKRRNVTSPVTPREMEKLIRLALAYRATEDNEQLRYLQDYFYPLMPDNKRRELFAFIAQPNMTVTPDSFEVVMQQIESSKEFIENYKVKNYSPVPEAVQEEMASLEDQ